MPDDMTRIYEKARELARRDAITGVHRDWPADVMTGIRDIGGPRTMTAGEQTAAKAAYDLAYSNAERVI
jgi:hypothetical protein